MIGYVIAGLALLEAIKKPQGKNPQAVRGREILGAASKSTYELIYELDQKEERVKIEVQPPAHVLPFVRECVLHVKPIFLKAYSKDSPAVEILLGILDEMGDSDPDWANAEGDGNFLISITEDKAGKSPGGIFQAASCVAKAACCLVDSIVPELNYSEALADACHYAVMSVYYDAGGIAAGGADATPSGPPKAMAAAMREADWQWKRLQAYLKHQRTSE